MTGPFRFPPDYEPPLPADVATNRATLRVVLSLFAAGIAACGLAFAFLI
jgi:hypothetical protein